MYFFANDKASSRIDLSKVVIVCKAGDYTISFVVLTSKATLKVEYDSTENRDADFKNIDSALIQLMKRKLDLKEWPDETAL